MPQVRTQDQIWVRNPALNTADEPNPAIGCEGEVDETLDEAEDLDDDGQRQAIESPKCFEYPSRFSNFLSSLRRLMVFGQAIGKRTARAEHEETKMKQGRGYRWTTGKRRRLQEMKQKGWSTEQISAELGR